MIHLDAVFQSYRDGNRQIQALGGIDLAVGAGEAVALMGKSGSGKSTLLHLIGGLEQPAAGRVVVAERELERLSDQELTRFRLHHIGFVFQFFHLLPTLSVLENLRLPAELAGKPKAWSRGQARALLAGVGLEERASSYPEQLSGGEQQRVAVARALMLEPPILLADEPTGNLDSETGSQVLDLLLRLSASKGSTLLVATHSPEVAGRAGRRLELRDGRILHDSAPAGAPATPAAPAPPDVPARDGP